MRASRPPRAAAGFTLLEVMIAFTILIIGLLGFMHFQLVAMNSTNGARMHTTAALLAQEIASGLERLPFGDPLLAPTGDSGPDMPSPFGRLLDASWNVTEGAHAWADDTPVPGVRNAGEAGWEYQRRWTVWGYSPTAGAAPSVKLIAVSVVYQEPRIRYPREVVVFTQISDPAGFAFNIAANQ